MRINGHGHILPEPNQIPQFMKDKKLFWIDDDKKFMRQGNWSRPITDPSFFLKEKLEWMEKYNIDEDDGKIVVVSVDVNSEAADKGLVEGDVIKRVGTQQVNSLKEFKKKEKASRKRGSLLLLVKKNDGSSRFVTLNY